MGSSLPPIFRFDGTNVHDWIFMISHFFIHQQTPEEERIAIASFYFDGKALAWYQWMYRNNQITYWAQFLCQLEIRFASVYGEVHPLPSALPFDSDTTFASNSVIDAALVPSTSADSDDSVSEDRGSSSQSLDSNSDFASDLDSVIDSDGPSSDGMFNTIATQFPQLSPSLLLCSSTSYCVLESWVDWRRNSSCFCLDQPNRSTPPPLPEPLTVNQILTPSRPPSKPPDLDVTSVHPSPFSSTSELGFSYHSSMVMDSSTLFTIATIPPRDGRLDAFEFSAGGVFGRLGHGIREPTEFIRMSIFLDAHLMLDRRPLSRICYFSLPTGCLHFIWLLNASDRQGHGENSHVQGHADITLKVFDKIPKSLLCLIVFYNPLESSRVLKGSMKQMDVTDFGKMRRRPINSHIFIFDSYLDYDTSNTQTNAELLMVGWLLSLRMEEGYTNEVYMQLLKSKSNLVFSVKRLSELRHHCLNMHGELWLEMLHSHLGCPNLPLELLRFGRHVHFGVNSHILMSFNCSCVLDVYKGLREAVTDSCNLSTYNNMKDGLVCLDRLGYVLVMFKEMHGFCFGSIEASCGSGKPLVIHEETVFMSYCHYHRMYGDILGDMSLSYGLKALIFVLHKELLHVLRVSRKTDNWLRHLTIMVSRKALPCDIILVFTTPEANYEVPMALLNSDRMFDIPVILHSFLSVCLGLQFDLRASTMLFWNPKFVIPAYGQSGELWTTCLPKPFHNYVEYLSESSTYLPTEYVIGSSYLPCGSINDDNSRVQAWQQWHPGEHFQMSKVLSSFQSKQWDPGKFIRREKFYNLEDKVDFDGVGNDMILEVKEIMTLLVYSRRGFLGILTY